MYMYDIRLGELDVEIDIPEYDVRKSVITSGYKLVDFQDLSEEEVEYLNERYYEDIVMQASSIMGSAKSHMELAAMKLLN